MAFCRLLSLTIFCAAWYALVRLAIVEGSVVVAPVSSAVITAMFPVLRLIVPARIDAVLNVNKSKSGASVLVDVRKSSVVAAFLYA